MEYDRRELSCPLCGHRFPENKYECTAGCPFAASCNLAVCPNCGYKIVRESKTVGWLRRLFGAYGRGR